jgi:hypothetical protein
LQTKENYYILLVHLRAKHGLQNAAQMAHLLPLALTPATLTYSK